MSMYYRSTITGSIVRESDVTGLSRIFGIEEVNRVFASDILIPIPEPKVLDLLEEGLVAEATFAYRKAHPSASITDCYAKIKAMQLDIANRRAPVKTTVPDMADGFDMDDVKDPNTLPECVVVNPISR